MEINAFLILAFLLAAGTLAFIFGLVVENILSPKVKPIGMGKTAIESAEKPLTVARRLGFQYYFYAMLFVVLEALFVPLFLWADSIRADGVYVFIGVAIAMLYLFLFIKYIFKTQNVLMEGMQ
ncbi:MAG: NADH-quinone oxidoreductase subunit A [Candidatus Parvarchaeota archaeon]|nr:NADH-quinone oxidoreductase subunit A [Candidatus Parvarchaeota archaeon]